MSFNFTGRVHRRNINLGNRRLADHNRTNFLQQLENQRKQRERERLETQAATTIEAAGRSYLDLLQSRKLLSQSWNGDIATFCFFFPYMVTIQDLQISLHQLNQVTALIRHDEIDTGAKMRIARVLVTSFSRICSATDATVNVAMERELITAILKTFDYSIDGLDVLQGIDFDTLFTCLFLSYYTFHTISEDTFQHCVLKYGTICPPSTTLLSLLSSPNGTKFVDEVDQVPSLSEFINSQISAFESLKQDFAGLSWKERITYLTNMATIFFNGEHSLVTAATINFWTQILLGCGSGVHFQVDIPANSTFKHVLDEGAERRISPLFTSRFAQHAVQQYSTNPELCTSFLFALFQFLAPQSPSPAGHTNMEYKSTLAIGLVVSFVSGDLFNVLFNSIASAEPYKAVTESGKSALQFFRTGFKLEFHSWWIMLYVFEELYSYSLSVTHDSDLFATGRLSGDNFKSFVSFLRFMDLYSVLEFRKFRGTKPDLPFLNDFQQTVLLSLKLLRQVYLRNLRLKVFDEQFWYLAPEFSVKTITPLLEELETKTNNSHNSSESPIFVAGSPPSLGGHSYTSGQLDSVLVLSYLPYMVPFSKRAEIFHVLIDMDKSKLGGWFAPKVPGTVSRENILLDSYDQFGSLPGRQFKLPLSVEFINKFGEKEAGIDGGGLTKELLTSIVKSAFIPSAENMAKNNGYRFFDVTANSDLYPTADYFLQRMYAKIYPDQTVFSDQGLNFLKGILRFLGMVIGKCLYENVLIDVSFAPFFLNKWLQRESQALGGYMGQRCWNSFDDLQSLDMELYRSLIKLLKLDSSELEGMDLSFTVTEKVDIPDGGSRMMTVDLIQNGSEIQVNESNKLQYAYYLARYKLDRRIESQTNFFLGGLYEIITPNWLSLFNPYEIQTLISGGDREFNVDDLQKNCVLGGYSFADQTIKDLFIILKEFNVEQKSKFLKFVTSSSKQPLLGFQELNPKFGIRKSGDDPERLPTASTCVNLLKLPNYHDKELLREKLLFSINADAGFDLS